jgi:hypothetical protein
MNGSPRGGMLRRSLIECYRILDDFQFPILASQMKHLLCTRPQYYKYMALVSQRTKETIVIYLFLCISFDAAVAKVMG